MDIITFFVDENYGLSIVQSLRGFGRTHVEHLLETFEAGTIDEKWLEYVGKRGYALITKDKNIRKNPKEKAALLKHKIVAFYLGGEQMGVIETGKQLINAWDKMEAYAKRQKKARIAGAFIVRPGGGRIDKIPLT